jgi:hypothetical protein
MPRNQQHQRISHKEVDSMHTSPELAREHTRTMLEQAQHARYVRTVTQIRKIRRMEQRAERQLLHAWRRSAELRASLETR